MSWDQVRIDLLDGVCQFSWAPIVLLFTLDWQHHSLHVLGIRPDIGLACPLSPSRLVWITMAFWLSMAHCMHLSKFSKICWRIDRVGFQFVRFGQNTWLLKCQLYPCHTEPLPHISPCYGRSKAHALVLQNWTGKIFLQDLIRSSDIGCARQTLPQIKKWHREIPWENIYEHYWTLPSKHEWSKLFKVAFVSANVKYINNI